MHPPTGETWVAMTDAPLPVAEALAWAVRPHCGAVVVFSGTVRDHAEGRPGVTSIDYEAYPGEVEPRLEAIAGRARSRWPDIGALALLHRVGPLAVEESSVVVVVSAPHRGEAFDAARYCIDTLKSTVPIWKRETWEDGEDWGLAAQPVRSLDEVDQVDEIEASR